MHLFGLLSITRQFLFYLAQIKTGVLRKGGGRAPVKALKAREKGRDLRGGGEMGYLLSMKMMQ